jgi:hypothetical protein
MPITLREKIVRLENEGPIDPSTVDFTVDNPEILKAEMGQSLAYGEAVEIEIPTTANVIRTILPNMDEEEARFIDIWDIQEAQHGVLLAVTREECDIEPLETRDTIPGVMKVLGKITGLTSGLHDAVEMIYLTEAALGEKETLLFYRRLEKEILERGENPTADLMRRIGSQEAAHLSYYIQAAREKRERLKPMQLAMIGRFIETTYSPVGVRMSRKDTTRLLHFGHAALELTDGVVTTVTDPVEKLARDLLGTLAGSSKPFLRKRYLHYIEEYKDSIAA